MRRALYLLRIPSASSAAACASLRVPQTPLLGVSSKRFLATAAAAASSGRKRNATHKSHAHARRPRPQDLLPSISISASTSTTANTRHQHPPRPKLRMANVRVSALLASHTASDDFVDLCEQLRDESQVELLADTDPAAWNAALRTRLKQGDVAGAHALVSLLLGFDGENASEQVWSGLLFTLLRQRSPLSSNRNILEILDVLREKCGDEFLGSVALSLVNGCANQRMFREARLLAVYHLDLTSECPLPSRVVANLVSKMEANGQHEQLVAFVDTLLKSDGVDVADMQAQMWIAVFQSCAEIKTNVVKYVDLVIQWFDAVKNRPVANKSQETPQFERVLGAAVQSCLATGHERPALRLFHAMAGEGKAAEGEDDGDIISESGEPSENALTLLQPQPETRIVQPDENIYVNVLKACRVLHDNSLFRDVYRRMVSDNVARSGGFGSAIRFAHTERDVEFLEEVLEDAFAVEETLRGSWYLPLEQYNDALGCFAETKHFDQGKELFSVLMDHPYLVPDHITMTEMIENYRESPFSDVFELLELFLEMELKPNKHVYTSLLATCGRHRQINDAMALLAAMKADNVELDVKTFTTLAFIYAVHGHLPGIVSLLQEMKAKNVVTDAKFFDTTLDGLYGAHGIDMCFSLFRDMLAAGLRIPQGMYGSLLRIGTDVGLVERTLHIAYNMECDGFPLSSAQLLALMRRCEAHSEVVELVRTFLMLHQGRQAVAHLADPEDEEETPRFSQEVYEEMVSLLAAFSQRDAIAKVRQLAQTAGYVLP